MCGLGVTLGKNKPPIPQAAHQLAKAILDDLEEADKKNKGKQKEMFTPDQAEGVSGKTKRMTRSSTIEDNAEKNVRGKTCKQATWKQPSVEGDGRGNDSEVVAENDREDEQLESEELSDEDEIVSQAINAEEKQDTSTRNVLFAHTLLLYLLILPHSGVPRSKNTPGERVTTLHQERMR